LICPEPYSHLFGDGAGDTVHQSQEDPTSEAIAATTSVRVTTLTELKLARAAYVRYLNPREKELRKKHCL
jgi:hypothetical protein